MANENANRKFIQFFRNQLTGTGLFASKEAAIAKLTGTSISPNVLKDGMPIVARYTGTDNKVHSILGIGHYDATSERTLVTVFDNMGGYEDAIKALDATVSATTNGVTVQVVETDGKLTDVSITSVDLGTLANYSKTATGTGVLSSGDTIAQAFSKLEKALEEKLDALDSNISAGADKYFTGIGIEDGKLVDVTANTTTTVANVDTAKLVDYTAQTSGFIASTDTIHGAFKNVEDKILGMDASTVANENNVVTDVTQTDGKITATSANITGVRLSGYAEGSDAKVASTDTLGQALGKLQGQINAMDLPAVSGEGQAIIVVSEADGKVSATAGDIAAAHVTTTTGATTFSGVTVQAALDEISQKVAANEITSSGKTLVLTTGATGTNAEVNIDGTTIVKDGNGVISSDLKILKVTTGLNANIREEYKLVYGDSTTAIGSPIDIYKDSSLTNVYLGHMDDKLTDEDATTHESPTTAVTTGTGDTALCFIYHLENGNYKLEKVDVQDFLEESEFKDGLQVSNHEVSVKVDSASESVITGSAGASGSVLSVSSNGVKVSNIQNAIDYAVSTLDADVTGTSLDGHVAVQVVEANGKVTGVTVTTSDIASASALTAEISARKAVDGINGDAYTANTGTNYISGATSLNDADVKLDAALKAEETARANQDDTIEASVGLSTGGSHVTTSGHYTSTATTIAGEISDVDAALYGLSGKAVTAVAMTGGTATITAATDGTKKIEIVTDGSQIKLDGYEKASAEAAIASGDTVNQALGKLEYKVDAASSGLQEEVDKIETAVGLNADGTHAQSAGHYTSGASSIEGEIVALDTQLSAVSNTYLSNAVAGNDAITVTVGDPASSGETVTVALKLDTVTTTTETTAQYASATGNALQITTGATGGLYLDSTWDCGFYS